MTNGTSLLSLETEADFLWLDMEFTGLDINQDVVVEVGAVLTRGLFDIQWEYSTFINNDAGVVVARMDANPWWTSEDRALHRELMVQESIRGGVSTGVADGQLWRRITESAPNRPVYLAGNSIHNDRKWIAKDFPCVESLLHYRMLDVSSFKLVIQSLSGFVMGKKECHRALSDIQESMQELQAILLQLKHTS